MKKIMCFLSIATCFLMNFDYSANASNYYVTEKGAGTHDGNSLTNALSAEDFNKLKGNQFAGDTFYFSGVFDTRIIVAYLEGSSGSPVTLDGYISGDCNPIDSVCSSSALLKRGMDIGDGKEGPDYITIQDFKITNQESILYGLRIYPISSGDDDSLHIDNLLIRRNYIYETNGGLLSYNSGRYSIIEKNKIVNFGQNGTDQTQGLNFVETDDLIIRNNEIGHDEKAFPSGCTSAELIELHGCKRMLIERNNIYGAPNQAGIRPKEHSATNMEDIVIRYNLIHDNGDNKTGKGVYLRTRATQFDTISNVFIYGNNISSNGIGGVLIGQGVYNVHVWSNLIEGNGRFGIDIWQGPADNMHFINNTIAGNGTLGDTDKARGGIVLIGGTNVNIKNNLFWNNRPNGEGGLYNQIYSDININNLQHNTYYHQLSTPNIYYDGSFRSITTMQNNYKMENNTPLGEIENPGIKSNYSLNGSYINNGADLSKCFEVSIQNDRYNLCYNYALDPEFSFWGGIPKDVDTIIQNNYGEWERGAYAFKENDSQNYVVAPQNVEIVIPD